MTMDKEGILSICELGNIAAPGAMPVEALQVMKQAYYTKRTVGYNRIYAAMGAGQRVDMVVRCHNTLPPDYGKQLYAVFEDGTQFRVSAIQEIVERDAVDLTLTRLEDLYDVIAGDASACW